MQKRILGSIFIPEKYLFRVCFESPFYEDDIQFSRRDHSRHELIAGSKIRDPVPAKFKHVTNIVTCSLLCCD